MCSEEQFFSAFFDAKITDYVIAAFTAFIAWFTWGLKTATLKLERATVDLVKEGANTAERQLRAYCMIAKAEILDVEIGMRPRAKITIKNSGQTPAKNFKQVATIGFDAFPPSLEPPSFNESPMIEHPLAPQGYVDSYKVLSRPLTSDTILALKNGSAAIYVVGEIYYEDAFGQNRITKYKLFAGGPIGIDGGMTACEDGNDYT